MDQPPPTSSEPAGAPSAEQAAARLIAAEESARQRAWRDASCSSTSILRRPVRRVRVLLLFLLALVIVLGLSCALLLKHVMVMDTPAQSTAQRAPPTPRPQLPLTATAGPSPAAVPEPIAAVSAADPPPAAAATPPPAPLVITIPVPAPAVAATEPAAPPAPNPAMILSADERRQLQNYEQRLVTGTDLLARDLTAREQAIARTNRRLTFEPGRQPPLGALEELAEALRHWEGAVGDERERLAVSVHNRRAEVANLQRQLMHDQEVAESLRKRLKSARQELDDVRKKQGPPQ